MAIPKADAELLSYCDLAITAALTSVVEVMAGRYNLAK
jgi:hypothetical protein